MNVRGASTQRGKAYLQCLGFLWDSYIHFQISFWKTFLWKSLYVVETEGLIAGMLFMPENEVSRETGKYEISLDNAKAEKKKKKVFDFKSLGTRSLTKEIFMCTRYLKETWLLVSNSPFLSYQCTFQLEITKTRCWL